MTECTECLIDFEGDTELCPDCIAATPATSSPVTVANAIAAIDAAIAEPVAIESTSDSQAVATVDGQSVAVANQSVATDQVAATEMSWLQPIDGHAVTQEAKSAVVESVARILPVATVTVRVTVPPEQGPTPPPPPGVLPPLEMEPCDCEPGCRETRVVGTRLHHACKGTVKVEDHAFHLATCGMTITEVKPLWLAREVARVRLLEAQGLTTFRAWLAGHIDDWNHFGHLAQFVAADPSIPTDDRYVFSHALTTRPAAKGTDAIGVNSVWSAFEKWLTDTTDLDVPPLAYLGLTELEGATR